MAFATSPDRSKLFLLTAGRRPAIGRIVVLDTQTLVRIRDFSVTRYYEDIAYDGSGNRIFGLDRTLGELVVLDAESGRELKIVRDVGRGLAFVVVPPS
jgi:DNA-binding beta-propeller fold protein YncE